MSLVLIWCLAGACKTHEIPLPPQPISEIDCAIWGMLKSAEMQPSYPGHDVKFQCVKGVRA